MEIANDFKAMHCIGKIRARPNNQIYLEYIDGRNKEEVCTTDKIIGYRMRTISNKIVSLKAEDVREALLRQSIVISNLQLDSMGRIVYKKADKSKSILEDFRKTYDNMIDYEVIQFKEPLTNEQVYQIQTYLKKEIQEKNKRISYKLNKQALMLREA